MNNFSISDLEHFSGIKAHTIRIWEQRYGALKPGRSEGNTRYYDSYQLRRLLNIVSLMNSEFKISELCRMSDEEMNEILRERIAAGKVTEDVFEYYVSQMILAAIEFDELRFDKLFSNCLLRFDFTNTYKNVIYPLLARLGLMWASDLLPPAQEHFITGLIKQKIFSAIDSIPPPQSTKKSWLLFLPENEFHDTGLLFSNYLLRKSGKKVFYLGSNVPYSSVKQATYKLKPAHLLFFLVRQNHSEQTQNFLSKIGNDFGETKICLAANPSYISDFKIPNRISLISSVQEFENIL